MISDVLPIGFGNIAFEGDMYSMNVSTSDESTIIHVMQCQGISIAKIRICSKKSYDPFLCFISTAEPCRTNGHATRMMRLVESICAECCVGKPFKFDHLSLVVENLDWRYEWYKRLGFKDDFHDGQLYLRKDIK